MHGVGRIKQLNLSDSLRAVLGILANLSIPGYE